MITFLKRNKPNKIDLSIFAGLILAIIIGDFSVFSANCEKITAEVVRLHILANSDSDADQALKYSVRDNLLLSFDEIFGQSGSVLEAEQTALDKMELIQEIAQNTVYENGYSYKVECSLVNMFFDTRVYENITMPAGYYDALRITIGNAEGKNWWCVMYPQLCLGAASDTVLLTKEQSELIENRGDITLKFALLEWIKKCFM